MRRLVIAVTDCAIQLCGSRRLYDLSLDSGPRLRELVHIDCQLYCFRQHPKNSRPLSERHCMTVRERLPQSLASSSCIFSRRPRKHRSITCRSRPEKAPDRTYALTSISCASLKARIWHRREGCEPSASGHCGSARPSTGTRKAGCSHAAAEQGSVNGPIGAGQSFAALLLAIPVGEVLAAPVVGAANRAAGPASAKRLRLEA